jgi:CysZ protein
MLKAALVSFKPSIGMVFKNKVNFVLSLIPMMMGILLYWFAGTKVYESTMGWGKELIDKYITEGTWSSVVYYLVATILTIMLFFVVNWTFVLVVAVIASPFNDVMSGRIEKLLNGQQPLSLADSFTQIGKNLFKTLFNEIKKVSLIITLTIISMVFGYIPILTPISVFIAIMLLAWEFLDYSWGRHKLTFGSCVKDMRQNLLDYALGGAFFFIIVSIPVVNLLVPPLATSYFTTLWVKNNENRNQVTG